MLKAKGERLKAKPMQAQKAQRKYQPTTNNTQ
jgi:hypothetical protein